MRIMNKFFSLIKVTFIDSVLIESSVLVTVNQFSEDGFGIILKTQLYFCHVATFRKCSSDKNELHMAKSVRPETNVYF